MGQISRPQFPPGRLSGCTCPRAAFCSNTGWLAALLGTAVEERGAGALRSPRLSLTEQRATSLPGASCGFLDIQLHSPELRAINSPNVNAAKGLGEPETGGRRSESQPQALPPPSRTSLLEARTSSCLQPAPKPQPSVHTRRSSPAGRPPALGGRATWAPGPRRGGRAAAPRTLAAPDPKHTSTHKRARRPIRSPGGVGRRFHSSSFIPPKARFPSPGRLHPKILGGSKGANCATSRPPSAHGRQVLSTLTHNPTDSGSITIGSVAPAQGPLPPRLPTASSPRSPTARPPRRATRLRPAALGSPRPGRPGTPPPPPPPQQPGSAGYSGVTPPPELRRGAGRGQGAGRKEEGAGSKSSGRPGPRRAPVSSQARPRGPPPGTRSHRLRCLGHPQHTPSLPSQCGRRTGAGARRRF